MEGNKTKTTLEVSQILSETMQNNPPGSHQYTEQEQKQKTDNNTTITTQKRTMEEAKWKYSPTQAKRERQAKHQKCSNKRE